MAHYLNRKHRSKGTGGTLAALLETEDRRPPTAWRLNGTGKLEEGLRLELNHPQTGGKLCVFVGEYFILRHHGNNGCFYHPAAGTGYAVARRIAVGKKEFSDGRKPMKLLVQPVADSPLLLHVSTAIPGLVRAKERMWVGIIHNGEVVAQDGDEALVVFPNRDGEIAIFYPDGSIKRVVREGDVLKMVPVSLEEQAEVRIDHVKNMLEIAADLSDDERMKREDFAQHQLVAIMRFGGRRSSTVFQETFGLLLNWAEAGRIRPGVRKHAEKVLAEHWPAHALKFGWVFDRAPTNGNGRFAGRDEIHTSAWKGPSPEEQARKRRKAAKDREVRNKMKGASSGGTGSGNGNGKNKKK